MVSGRMCSSPRQSSISFVLRFLIGTGTTSFSKTQSSHALAARCWLRSATSSTAVLSSLYLSARFSAVSAMENPH